MQPARPEQLAPGAGALVTWRNPQGLEGQEVPLFWLLRLNATPAIDPALDPADARGMLAGGLIAVAAFSPYGCCPLTWHQAPLAATDGHWDHLWQFCQVEAAFDPSSLVPAAVPPRRAVGLG